MVEVVEFTLQNLLEVAMAVVWAGPLVTEIMATGLGPSEGAHQKGVSLIKLLETDVPHRKVIRIFFAKLFSFRCYFW